jgi:hypothetical protein
MRAWRALLLWLGTTRRNELKLTVGSCFLRQPRPPPTKGRPAGIPLFTPPHLALGDTIWFLLGILAPFLRILRLPLHEFF